MEVRGGGGGRKRRLTAVEVDRRKPRQWQRTRMIPALRLQKPHRFENDVRVFLPDDLLRLFLDGGGERGAFDAGYVGVGLPCGEEEF
jgi:hypothetical protein